MNFYDYKNFFLRCGVIAFFSVVTFTNSSARNLAVGVNAEPTSMDPHYHNLTPNNQINASVFESLTRHDNTFKVMESLAVNWRLLDEVTWEFVLRKGVKFHDGSDFDAYDVVFSICRVPEVENSPGSFASFTKAISSIEVVNSHKLLFRTDKAFPLLPKELASVAIISGGDEKEWSFIKEGCQGPVAGWPTTEDFNLAVGNYSFGTGPYKLKRFIQGDKVVLSRNDNHWGEVKPWSNITIKRYPSGAPAVVALLNGEVDLIENPPVENFGRIMREGLYNVYSAVTSRVIYIMFNHQKEGSPPTVSGAGGRNPFSDARVRRAVSLAVNRDAIADRIMGNFAVPANQYLHPKMFGTDKNAKRLSFNPELARQLLSEAGYPEGFDVTFFATNDRYTNDYKIARSIAAMLTRIGIRTKLETVSKSSFFKRRNKGEYAIWMAGWGAASGEMSNPLRALVATRIENKGFGTVNRGGYSNKLIDNLLDRALQTIETNEREQLLVQAQGHALKDFAVVPIHFETKSWAMRREILYLGRADEFTLVSDIGMF
ncbi:MAG: ABC transporter substrate-binding protein [Arenicella sp.]